MQLVTSDPPHTPPDYHPYSQAARSLYADGYTLGPPPWGNQSGAHIDREVCEEAVCECCGREGLTLQAFHHRRPRSYIALAVCPACLHCEEF